MSRRLRLAFFSPLPPTRSGIADFNAALLPYLASEAEITLFVDSETETNLPFLIQPIEQFPDQRDQFDLAIYHIGNNALHRDIYEMACRYPGLAVLHDTNLSQFLSHELMVEQGNTPSFIRELAYEQGLNGYAFGRRLWLNQVGAEAPEAAFNKRLVRRSLGVVAHNKVAQAQLQEQHPDRPVHHIPLLVNQFPDGNLRHQLDLPDAILFATIGQLNKLKQVEWSLEQFAAVRNAHPNAHFLLVGEVLASEVDIPATVSRLGLKGAVHHVGYVEDPADFLRWTAAADVVVALREPTLGETSAAALNAMAASKPLIVFDQGWYGELAASVAVKVPAMDPEAFQHALRHFLQHPDEAVQMGEAGLRYVREMHRPELVANAYFDVIAEVLVC